MHQLFNKIKLPLLAKINIGYYDGELKKLVLKSNGKSTLLPATDSFKATILIVARSYYQEKLVTYPLTNSKELKKLLILESTQANVVNSINLIGEGQSWVNQWQFNVSLPKARVVLPESLILSASNGKTTDIEVNDDKLGSQLFVAKSDRGIYSANPSKLLTSRLLFCQSSGLPFNEQFTQIKQAEYAEALIAGLIGLPLKKWQMFSHLTVTPTSLKTLTKPALTMSVIGVLYLVLTSVFIGWNQWQIENKLEQNSSELTKVLRLETKNNKLRDSLSMYHTVTQNFVISSSIWQVLLPLFEQAKFSQVQFVNKRFILRGETNKATDVLSVLANSTNVEDAKFDLPVSKVRLKERFTISFVLRHNKLQVP